LTENQENIFEELASKKFILFGQEAVFIKKRKKIKNFSKKFNFL
jgi:hypothetical protein